ncbi:MAG: hypothetical protein OXU33_13830 [Gemmatimonadota bacterium]|nr:hypothetical protein [Gemmatimonadota bacterium]MDE3006377.1 hypothetical protein [Gemmatimonadota bacterium]MDE3015143.1 hypothetical protein [Gemmatimonadota bacterium]
MSKPEDSGSSREAAAFERLQRAVIRLVKALEHAQQRLDEAQARVDKAEERNSEMAEMLQQFTDSPAVAQDIVGRLETLERENEDLRLRIDRGRAGVERMIARIHFLENQG